MFFLYNKKLHRALSLVLCIALLFSSVPNTVTAAELHDKNDIDVINDNLEITDTEEETDFELEIESEPDNETESTTKVQTTLESESVFESESIPETVPESESETEVDFEIKNETDTNFESESTSAFDTASEAESEIESELSTETEPETNLDLQTVIDAFNTLAAEKPLMALLYRTDTYEVRQNPSNDKIVATINSGHTLYIKSVEIFDDNVWYQVQFGFGGSEYTGYIEDYYLAYSDEDWINWENDYLTRFFTKK